MGKFSQIKGAIFDFDGTLLDSMWLWTSIGAEYLKSMGILPESDVDREILRMSLKDAAEYIRAVYNLDQTPDEIRAGVNKLVEKSYFESLELKPGVMEMIKRLQADGVRMCVATASDRYMVEAAIQRTGLAPFLHGILTCTELSTTKSTPVIYEAAAKLLGTGKTDTLVFEDAAHAVKTAKDAGFTVIGIYDPTEEDNIDFIKATADFYLRSPAEWKNFYDAD